MLNVNINGILAIKLASVKSNGNKKRMMSFSKSLIKKVLNIGMKLLKSLTKELVSKEMENNAEKDGTIT